MAPHLHSPPASDHLEGVHTPADQVSVDWTRAHRETPGCQTILHFNNAGAALPPACVTNTITSYVQREAEIGGYEAAEEAADQVETLYQLGARLLSCSPDDIAYCHSATHAWSLAFEGLCASGQLTAGQVILTGQCEYSSGIIAFARAARRWGIKTELVADNAEGTLCLRDLEHRLRPQVGLIALTHVPTNGGAVTPVPQVGKLARQSGVPYLLDACQSAGQMPLNVEDIGCDILTLTGRKYLRGPRGSGLLYINQKLRDRMEPLMLDMRGARLVDTPQNKDTPPSYTLRPGARRYELWESSIALRLGLAQALDYALGWGLDNIETRVTTLADQLRRKLGDLPGLTLHDKGTRKCGIVSFTHPSLTAVSLRDCLRQQKINISVSQPEMTWHDAKRRELPPLARASVHYYNDENEVERFVNTIATTISS